MEAEQSRTILAEPFQFTGSGGDYFRIWIVNIALTIVTLGIYSAWAKVRRLQYFHRNTRVAGSSFDYHGSPIAILEGRLVAFALLVMYNVAEKFDYRIALLVALPIAIALPWMLRQSLRFRLHYSSWRGLRFAFHGRLGGAYLVFMLWPILAVLTLGLLGPMWHQRLKRYQHDHSAFGSAPFRISASIREFYDIYGRAMLIVLSVAAVPVVLFILAGIGNSFHGWQDNLPGVGILAFGLAVFAYSLLIRPYRPPPSVSGLCFDGRTSARFQVRLTLDTFGVVHVEGPGIDRFEPATGIRVSEPLGGAPRLLSFPDGAYCELSAGEELDRFLDAIGHSDSPVVRAQSRWSWAIGSATLLVVALFAGYRYGLPWAAEKIAERIPAPVVTTLSAQTLTFLDKAVFEPSKLPGERRTRLTDRFRRLTPPGGPPVPHDVLFRASPDLGANALALPSGTIIVTDELVQLTQDDDEILAVLTHELGHVQERHGLRLLVESSVVGVLLTWYIGDVSSLAASVPAALLQAKFSRTHEAAADAYGARMLEANGLSPALLASMLEKLAASHGSAGAATEGKSISDYLSSHPATRERIEALRRR